MFPISLNVTYEVAKQLMYYIFPERKVKAALNSSSSASQGEHKRKKSEGDAVSSHSREASSTMSNDKNVTKKGKEVVSSDSTPKGKIVDELLQMQTRASTSKSFIYIKVPSVQLCLSYKVCHFSFL
jgi:hypothetical protein